MEIESAAQEKSRVFAWLKALPGKAKDKIVNVGKSIKKLGKDDPRRVIHSLKVGLALTLVSLFYYWRPLYDGFGMSGMWAVLTVVVVFEFSVGATLGKGINRACATLSAAALGLGSLHLSSLFGKEGEPIVLGFLVFLLAAAATFTRFFPKIKARYDYGVIIFILTFSMISISGYRVDSLLEMAHQRLSTILIGGATCIFVSIFVCPVWAGQDLHNLIASNIDKLANYLEGFGGEYFQVTEDKDSGGDSKNDKSFLQGYKSVLNSKTTEETLANFAKWEPGHGRFLFRHPWKQYLKIGALVRQCTYQIEALNSHLTSDMQTPPEFTRLIQESCINMSSESGKALKSLSSAIKSMKHPNSATQHVENSKAAVNGLKAALEAAAIEDSDLLAIISAATVASTLFEIVECVEKISDSVHELSQMAHFKKVEATVSPEKPQLLLHRGTVKPVLDSDSDHVTITIHGTASDSLEKENPRAPKPREGE
ncbi:Aluminum-activated malate transporter [Parasponia andersonii]|uniref:Aluminum-activated malate transporter n=1 Tax=Parasponia andersonii TaxID=3476 RepID=A0A2P5CQ35_PARAD|nr:Aluminum-activated malate transporter [Parasponia andersonii]